MLDTNLLKELVTFACKKNKVHSLAKEIKFEFNPRFSSRIADANFEEKIVRISEKLWHFAKPSQKKEIILHETCHIIAPEKHQKFVQPHGMEWKEAMQNCGFKEINIYHDINLFMLKRTYEVFCSCSKQNVSKRIYNAINNGFKIFCLVCGEKFCY